MIEGANLLLDSRMLVQHTHHVLRLFAPLKVILDLDKVLDELNVCFVQETEEFGLESSQIKGSYVQFLCSHMFSNMKKLTK
jgi:hypothetical protein